MITRAVSIGYDSVKAALEAFIANQGGDLERGTEGDNWGNYIPSTEGSKSRIRVVQHDFEGVSLAYALRWSDFFNEWGFLTRSIAESEESLDLGSCVEGVRVLTGPPGFTTDRRYGGSLIAMSNIIGRGAPRTNVARSNFETTDEYRQMLAKIYFALHRACNGGA